MTRREFGKVWVIAPLCPAILVQALSAEVRAQGRRGAVQPAAALDERALDRLLANWERENAKVRDLDADFRRITSDPVFGMKEGDEAAKELAYGRLRFLAPDKGSMEIRPTRTGQPSEQWVCTGLAVYEVVPKDKRIIMHPLPPEAHGENISEGPLPFLFGMNAEKAKQRYQITLLSDQPHQAYVRVFPRQKRDAQNFSAADLVVDKKTYTIHGVKTYEPNRREIEYVFDRTRLNSSLKATDFLPPRVPPGWRFEQDRPAAGAP